MKKIAVIAVTTLLILFILFSPEAALDASKNGLTLWFTQLLPALLPFSILSYIILHSGMLPSRLKTAYIIMCGFLFGFPIGGKLTADFYEQKLLSRRKASILCAFTNNLSPAFVTASLQGLLQLSPSWRIYFLLYGIPLCYGLLMLALYHRKECFTQKETASRFHMDMQIIDAGIINGFETLIRICGYIVLFSIICASLHPLLPESSWLLLMFTGTLEVTNGISVLSSFPCSRVCKLFAALFFLSWGGLSGIMQASSILHHAGLSVSRYVIQKLFLSALVLCGSFLLFLAGWLV